MEVQNKFKITFKNSWWQCIVSLLVGRIFIYPIIVYILVFSHIGLEKQDVSAIANIASLIFAGWFAFYLSRKTWEKKNTLG